MPIVELVEWSAATPAVFGSGRIFKEASFMIARRYVGDLFHRMPLLALVCAVGLPAGAASAENRAMDGRGNNPLDAEMGATFTMEMRMAPVAYADGVSVPSGADRPNPRDISNIVCDQVGMSIVNDSDLSDWVWQWGQFIDHDITLSEFMVPQEAFDIEVPMGDPMFDPMFTGSQTIRLDRSIYDAVNSGQNTIRPRQQMNQITAFIDGSGVYGSDDDRAAWLRTGAGGRLKTSEGNLLPFNDGTQVNAGPGGLPSTSTDLFTAGDIRASEQSGLTAVHTLFVREHNRLADQIAAEHPDWNDEQIYQRARKLVGATIQNITYREFLPALLGPMAPDPDAAAYDMNVDARIANEFANAGYRIGHTMLSPQVMRLDNNGDPIGAGALSLRDAFFDPSRIIEEGGIEPLLMGLAKQPMQMIDSMVVDDVRNFLFGQPGQGGFDLASLNIQRGRDHGLPDYNTVRVAYGLAAKQTFSEITSDADTRQRLEEAYGDVNLIDPWVGGLAEDHLEGAAVGELVATILADQFTRLRDGDRFWYANDDELSAADIATLESTRLSDVIARNTDLSNIPGDVFRVIQQPDDGGDGDGNGNDNGGGGPMPEPEPAGLCGMMGMASMLLLAQGLWAMRGEVRRRRR